MKKDLLLLGLLLGFISPSFSQDQQNNYPVSLERFNAGINNQKVVLTWKTICYLSYAQFQIQRSTDGTNYTTINSFSADRLRCQQPFLYEDDALPQQQRLFYRINAGDLDGNYFHSRIAQVSKDGNFSSTKIFPTIAQNNINITYTSNNRENLTIRWISALGSIVRIERVTAFTGNNVFNFDIGNLKNGVYRVNIVGTKPPVTLPFIKQ